MLTLFAWLITFRHTQTRRITNVALLSHLFIIERKNIFIISLKKVLQSLKKYYEI